MRPRQFTRLLVICGALLLLSVAVAAQRGGGTPNAIATLKGVPIPQPDLAQYVADRQTLIVLGKALFWDVQAGSDGRTACATCHFHAGADHRIQNQLTGPDAVMNQVLTSADFPFRKLSNTGNNRSAVISDKRQAAGSMGVVANAFAGVEPGNVIDVSNSVAFASPFMPNGVHVRQVTARNSPSVINAVYNVRNFWD